MVSAVSRRRSLYKDLLDSFEVMQAMGHVVNHRRMWECVASAQENQQSASDLDHLSVDVIIESNQNQMNLGGQREPTQPFRSGPWSPLQFVERPIPFQSLYPTSLQLTGSWTSLLTHQAWILRAKPAQEHQAPDDAHGNT
jgi:hypothetical protein